jgi:Amidase
VCVLTSTSHSFPLVLSVSLSLCLSVHSSAGGSSGGEGALIAAGGSPLGIGSDVGGSLRVPASWNGIVSLKPTQGRVPLTDCAPGFQFWEDWHPVVDMLTVGPMARYVQDLVLAVDVIAGGDHVDPQASLASPFSALSGRKSPRDLRVGYFYDDGHTPTTPSTHAAIDRALDALRAAGVVNIVHSAPSFFADATFLLLRCWCVCVSVSECVCMCVCVYVMSICGVVVVDFLMLSFVWHGVCMCVCVCVCVWVCDDTCIYSPQQVYIIISLLQSPSVFFLPQFLLFVTHSLSLS